MAAIDEYLQQILDAVYGEEVRGAIHDAILQTYEDGSAGVPRSRTINGHPLSSDIVLTASDVNAVPTTRKVNDKALSQDITLAASDVGAVPTTRKVNNKALSQDITLSASDVGAVNKTGDTMTGGLTIGVSDGVGITFLPPNSSYRGLTIRSTRSTDSNTQRGYFYQFKSDNTHYDLFRLPSTDVTGTENGTYDVLTSKSAVSIDQGGTGARTAAAALTNLGAVPLAGGTMTGLLTLSGAPTSNMHAATKKYVDDAVAAGGGGGGGGGDDYVLKAGDTMTGRLNAPNITSYGDSWPAFRFSLNSDGESSLGSVNFDTVNNRIAFISKSNNNTSTREIYHLPASSGTDGETTHYEILTTKPLDTTTAATVRTNLGLGSLATKNSLAASDIPALSYLPIAGGTMTGTLTAPTPHVYDSALPSIVFKSSDTASTYTALLRSRISDSLFYISIRKNGNAYGESYKLPVPTSTSETTYNIITDKDLTQTLPGQLILSKTTDVNGSASSEGALVIGTKTGEHLAFDTNEIMAKTSATAVGPLNLNYDGGNIIMGVNNTSYHVQIRSTAAATSTTTGALRVGGGAGIGGAVYANGLIEGADLRCRNPSWPCVQFTNAVAGATMGQIHLTVSSRIMTFREVTTKGNTIYEDFSLPAPTITSGTKSYSILTTKSVYYSASLPSSGTNGDICLVPV